MFQRRPLGTVPRDQEQKPSEETGKSIYGLSVGNETIKS